MKLSTEDADLVRRYQEGDQDAFRLVFQRHYQYVYKVFIIKGVPELDAEDFTQDIFLKLTESLLTFEFRSTFKTYLDRIITHRVIDFYRKRPSEHLRLELRVSSAPDPHSESDSALPEDTGVQLPIERMELTELQEAIRACLARMRNLARRAVVAMWLDGFKLRQISQILSLRPGTVNSHVSRGRVELRRCLRAAYAS